MNKPNALITLFLAIGVLQISCFEEQVFAQSTLQLNTHQQITIPVGEPLYYDDFTMIPVREVLKDLGASVNWIKEAKKVTAKRGNLTIEIMAGYPYALVNQNKVWLDMPPVMIKDNIYVPLGLISSSFEVEINSDPLLKMINVRVNQKGSSSKEKELPLTLDQALAWAETNSQLVKQAEQDFKKQEVMKQIQKNESDDYRSNEVSLEMAKKMKEVAKDQALGLVKQAYGDIHLKEEMMKLRAMSFGITVKEEEIISAKYQIGLISKEQRDRAVEAKALALKNLQLAKLDLEKAKVKLNHLMGKSEESVFRLVDRIKYEKSEVRQVDLESYISIMKDKNPFLWQLEKQLEIEKEKDSNGYKGYELKKMTIENAEATLEIKNREFTESIKMLNSTLEQLEEQYQSAKSQLEAAEKELLTNISKYEKGWITLLDIMKKQLIVEEKRKELSGITFQIDQVQYKWEIPWL